MPKLTAETRAKRAMLKMEGGTGANIVIKRIAATICEAEKVARHEEREACAALAQHWEDLIGIAPNCASIGHQIAAAVRAQSLDQTPSAMTVETVVERYPNFDLETAVRALHVIEGLTFEDITRLPKEKIDEIYGYAHIGLGHCENPHPDWCKQLAKAEEALIKAGIIDAFPEGGDDEDGKD